MDFAVNLNSKFASENLKLFKRKISPFVVMVSEN